MIVDFLARRRVAGQGRRFATWFTASILLMLVGAPASAWADCVSTFPGPEIGTAQFSGSVVVPRDVPIGTELARFTWKMTTSSNVQLASCAGPYTAELAAPVTPFTPASTGGVFPTNVAGVGVKVTTQSGTVFPRTVYLDAGSGLGVYNNNNSAVSYIFVKTGGISGGTVSGADVPSVALTYLPSVPIYRVSALGAVTFLAASCTTPDVWVDLGHHLKSEFTGAGYTTANVAFNLQLNNCPAGMNSIKYRIDPVTNVQLPAKSVVALDATSSATGVGVQLLTSSGGAHPLGAGTDQVFTSYSRTTGGSYTIPLKARYYQTGATVTSGLANTTMMFTMTYQ